MISVIICSINPSLLEQVKANITQTIGVEHEVVAIDNNVEQLSIAAAYNRGARQAKFPHLCFMHEDVLFHTDGWGVNLIKHFSDPEVALIGVLGCVIKTKAPSGVYIPIQQLNRVNQIQRKQDGSTELYYHNPASEASSEVKILDGMFLATTAARHAGYPFDEKMLTAFHGYDVDYSLGQSLTGKVLVVYDILLEHFSYGGNTTNWVDAQLLITEKWRAQLPSRIKTTGLNLKIAEIVNLENLLITLFNTHYNQSVKLKYILQLLYLRPFGGRNFYFLRKFFLSDRTDNALKNFYKKFSGKGSLHSI